MSEPKITECWTEETESGRPYYETDGSETEWNRPAILMWREDYVNLQAKARAAEFVEAVNQALSKSKDVYFMKLKTLLSEKELSQLIDEAHG